MKSRREKTTTTNPQGYKDNATPAVVRKQGQGEQSANSNMEIEWLDSHASQHTETRVKAITTGFWHTRTSIIGEIHGTLTPVCKKHFSNDMNVTEWMSFVVWLVFVAARIMRQNIPVLSDGWLRLSQTVMKTNVASLKQYAGICFQLEKTMTVYSDRLYPDCHTRQTEFYSDFHSLQCKCGDLKLRLNEVSLIHSSLSHHSKQHELEVCWQTNNLDSFNFSIEMSFDQFVYHAKKIAKGLVLSTTRCFFFF